MFDRPPSPVASAGAAAVVAPAGAAAAVASAGPSPPALNDPQKTIPEAVATLRRLGHFRPLLAEAVAAPMTMMVLTMMMTMTMTMMVMMPAVMMMR